MKPLLEELAREAREQANEIESDPRWRALAEGRLNEQEANALFESVKDDEKGRLKYKLLAPVPKERRDKMAEAALAGLREKVEPQPAPPAPPPSRSSRWRAASWGGGVALALAAAVTALIILEPKHVEAPVPPYEMKLQYGTEKVRSRNSDPTLAAPQHVDLRADMPFELELRPDEAPSTPIEFLAFIARDERIETWRPNIEAAATGAVRIRGTVGQLFPDKRGEIEIFFVVASPQQAADLRRNFERRADLVAFLDAEHVRVLRLGANIQVSE